MQSFLITRLLISISNFFVKFWGVLILILALVIGYKIWVDTENGKRARDKLILKMPIIGMMISKIQLAQFTRLLGLLLGSGLPIIKALELAASH